MYANKYKLLSEFICCRTLRFMQNKLISLAIQITYYMYKQNCPEGSLDLKIVESPYPPLPHPHTHSDVSRIKYLLVTPIFIDL